MASSLFPKRQPQSLISNVKKAIGGDPQCMFDQMYRSNLQFRHFADSLRGKTPEQAFKENGLDFNDFKNIR